jgi:peptidoglycan/xylan/chitin deacetylase (PgdA/CDA1 family)
MCLETGMFIVSIDVDVGSRELGVVNEGKNDANIVRHMSECRVGEIEEAALPLFLEVFDKFEVPVTFAIRGQLAEVGYSVLELLINSSVKHDIGAHGYYHREFINLSRGEAERELRMISARLNEFGVTPRSFVFPRNSVAYLDLLKKYEYKCYRGYGDFLNDCMYIEIEGQLCNVHPSLYLGDGTSFMFLKKILDISIARKLPFHVWFHPWNFGETEGAMQNVIKRVFTPFLFYARRKEREGVLNFETMLSAALKVEDGLEG